VTENNPNELAGASGLPVPVAPPEAREVFPVMFEKDYKDFTGVPIEDEPVVPKASSAPVSVTTPTCQTKTWKTLSPRMF
jgi:hypothetical protein